MSRVKLQFYNLDQRPGQDLCLKIPIGTVYSPIIDRALPTIEHIGWREGTKGTRYTYIRSISPEDRKELEKLLDLLQNILCLTITEHLDPHFDDELDEAYAIDFNFRQEQQPLEYTTAGAAEHSAKEEQNAKAIAALANCLAEIVQRHPTLRRADLIAAVPPRPSKKFHLPTELAAGIGKVLNRETGLKLSKIEHEKLKTLAIGDKVETLKKAFALGQSVEDRTILLIDDLYQSGVTLWSLAKFLKKRGAREVYGLACVKSWSDTDNV
jgi:predicted amidophosphoribosyltransferase